MNRTARASLAALTTLHELNGEATPEQREILTGFTGWGALAPALSLIPSEEWLPTADLLDTLVSPDALDIARDVCDTSFFTPATVTRAVFDLLRATGFTGGRVLEPGCGSGAFIGAAPADLLIEWTGVDIDPTATAIARALHPAANILTGGLQTARIRSGSFDAVVGNVPFARTTVHDPNLPSKSLHEYFILRALDAVKPGGYVIVATSRHVLDAERADSAVFEGADLISAVRLPSGTFPGTDVVADVLVLRRRANDVHPGWALPTRSVERALSHRYGTYTSVEPIDHEVATGEHRTTISGRWTGHEACIAGTLVATGYDPAPLRVHAADIPAAISAATAAAAAYVLEVPQTPTVGSLDDVILEDELGRKVGSFQIIDGTVMQVRENGIVPVARAGAELRALIALRDAALELIEQESHPERPDAVIAPVRAAALELYTAYAAKFGALNRGNLVEGKVDPETGEPTYSWRRPPMGGFRRDPDYVSVLALEQFDQGTGEAGPAPILIRRVGAYPPRATTAASAEEALAISLAETRTVDLARIGGLLSCDEPEARGRLGGAVFADPETGDLLTARDYLSGDVRRKLERARAAGERYAENIAALEAVMPAELTALDIRPQLGATWIPALDVENFAQETFGCRVTIQFTPAIALWESDSQKWARASAEAQLAYGTRDKSPIDLLLDGLNGKSPTVYDEFYDAERGTNRKVRDPQRTLAAEEKLRTIQDRFATWLWEDKARAERIVTEYNRRFNSHVARRGDGSYLTFDGLDERVSLWAHQRDAVDRVVSSDRVIIAHPVGAGKAQPMDSLVLTPTGFRRMGDFMVGDDVIAPDGSTTKITGVFPQGPLGLYRVTFSDGAVVECNDEHLWNVATHEMRRARVQDNGWKTLTLREIVKSSLTDARGQLKYWVPQQVAADFDGGGDRPLDPYWLGLLLGDGCVTTSAVDYTSADDELVQAFEAGLPEGQVLRRSSTRPHDYHVRSSTKGARQPLIRILRAMGVMGSDAPNKSVPTAYLNAPVADRLALLQGLMDTDGDVSTRRARGAAADGEVVGSGSTFNTSSIRLAEDVAWIVRSLGGTIGRGINSRKIDGRLHYRVTVRLPENFNPFRLQRKASAYVPASKMPPKRFIRSVELIGAKPMQCISVAHKDRLYVTNDFVVTHNTLSQIVSAMKLRQLGLARKPLIIVPNHLLEQISREAQQAYPTGRFLIASKDDLARNARRLFAARCATGDWDAVVMTHQAFTSIPVSAEAEEAWLQEQKADLRWSLATEGGGARGAKQVAAAVRKLEDQIAKLRGQVADAGTITFDQLGIDHISVDEIHMFRRDHVATRAEGFSLGSSKRATDLRVKVSVLAERRPGMPVLAGYTGTLLSNTLAECYVWQRLLQPERLAAAEATQFDAWAATFVKYETNVEVAPDGSGFRMQRRPSAIRNVPELSQMMAECCDILRAEDLDLDRPEAEWETVVCEPGLAQASFVSGLAERADALRSGVRKGSTNDNMLVICTDGRRVALDPLLVGLAERSPKVAEAARRIVAQYRADENRTFGASRNPGSLQLVLCDIGTPHPSDPQTYGRLRAALVAGGIPMSRIRFIHEATTDKARAHLFAQCREGAVSVLIGSTDKVGVGTNIQTRLTALHHLDAPWRPSDVEQREGRAIRPGNLSGNVRILRYVTERTFDAFMWETLTRKARFIAQFIANDGVAREVADISDTVLSFSEVKALAAGNPLLLRQAELAADARRLLVMRSVWSQTVNGLNRDAATLRERAASARAAAEVTALAAAKYEADGASRLAGLVDEVRQGRGSYTRYEWRGLDVGMRPSGYNERETGPRVVQVCVNYHTAHTFVVHPGVARRSLRAVEEFILAELTDWASRLPIAEGRLLDSAGRNDRAADEAADAAGQAVFEHELELREAEALLDQVTREIADEASELPVAA
ncbi:helicase-related protein [Agromyces subbeticus]|uniref:helicase-related protein n=1 Tax=Agromyces subbeticus TaxID=293890 RepID=UPI0003B7A714|nr:helicase-related protein [Agromyces subbeticus]